MKYHLGFFALLLSVLGLVGYLSVAFGEQHLFIWHGANEDAGQVLESFHNSHAATLEVNFTALYGGSGQFELLHPMLDMRKLQIKEIGPSCGVMKLAWSSGVENVSSASRVKSEMLMEFLNVDLKLPENFLNSPPFVDNSGYSYANFLAHKIGKKAWIEQHLAFFKASELKDFLQRYQIDNPQFTLISRLSDSEMEDVIRAEPLVLTKDYALIKNESRYGFSPLSYLVYDIQDLQAFLKNGKYDLLPYSSDALCLQRLGNACWTYNSRHTLAYLYRYSMALLIFSGVVFVIFLGFYIRFLYEKNKTQQRHRLALQVLSHEFRTPVSSLLLLVEQLTRDMSHLNGADQDDLTRIATEVYRLQRIVEVSKTYLQAEGRRIPFQQIEIASINTWLCDFVLEFENRVQVQLLTQDRSLSADPFWLKFVLSSLLQNAFAHGRAPVWIRLSHSQNRLKVTVEDQGHCEFDSLGQMSDAFVKSTQSKGMGLGLNIAKFIVAEWGSEIQFSKFPTAFTLSLSEARVHT